ncbi:twin-arginine translocase subunit TatC [Nanohaloarchaea archaeon H01]|nr:twin-arginine translocase subunit TatC [Nanohaloarchaea archaeon H01]
MVGEGGELKAFDEHLEELRSCFKHIAIVFVVLMAFFFMVSDQLLLLMQRDVSVSLNALTPFEVLNVRLSMAAILGLIGSLPVFIYSFISFARPGLTDREYRILRNFLPVSYLLFVVGSVFAYQVVFKNAVNFFAGFTEGAGVAIVWGLQNTLMLGLRISILTGFLFQLPILVLILNKSGLVSVEQLRKYRSYVIVLILLVAAVATPPDVLTQVMITLPIVLLYEASVLVCEYF